MDYQLKKGKTIKNVGCKARTMMTLNVIKIVSANARVRKFNHFKII